jgi:hypothetical protein
MTNFKENEILINLEKLYRILEKRISVLIIKEIKKQLQLDIKNRV